MGGQEALNQWQIEEIKKALAEADRGNFASEEEIQQTFRKRMHSTLVKKNCGEPPR